MAGLDGIKNKIDPGEAMDKNLYDLPPEDEEIPRLLALWKKPCKSWTVDRESIPPAACYR
ncbi:hypothetical protein ACNKHS_23240 [Shigella flexneri]